MALMLFGIMLTRARIARPRHDQRGTGGSGAYGRGLLGVEGSRIDAYGDDARSGRLDIN